MKKFIIFVIGIFAMFIIADVSAQSLSKSQKSKEVIVEPVITVPEIGLHINIETNYGASPENNFLLVQVGKSKKFSETDDIKGLRKFPLYFEEITLQSIGDCYKNTPSPFGDALCILYEGDWFIIYCLAEDCEEFPGRYLYIQYGLSKSTNQVIYDLVNLKLSKNNSDLLSEYAKPLEKKVK